jgi:hypothetical protein
MLEIKRKPVKSAGSNALAATIANQPAAKYAYG